MRQEWESQCQFVGREKWQNVNELIIKLKWDASRLTTSAMEKYPNPKGINLIEPSPSKKLFSAAKKKLFSNYEISDSVMMSPSSTMFRFLLNGTSQPWICQSVTFSFSLVLPFFSRPLVSVPKMDTAAPTTSRCRAGTPLSLWLILALSPIILRGINRLSFILWLNISVCHPVTRGLEVVNIYSIMYIYKDIYIYIHIFTAVIFW